MEIKTRAMVTGVSRASEWDEVRVAEQRTARFEFTYEDQETQAFTIVLDEAQEAALRPLVGHGVQITIELP